MELSCYLKKDPHPPSKEKYAGVNLKQDNLKDTRRTSLIESNDERTGRSRVLSRSSIILRGRHHPFEDDLDMVVGQRKTKGC
jgi:hypothetical protein